MRSKPISVSAPKISLRDIIVLTALLVFLTGTVWAYFGMTVRTKLHRQWLVSVRNAKMAGEVRADDLELMSALESAMVARRHQESPSIEPVLVPTGIELTSDIQSFLHEYRQKFSEKNIIVENRNLGFEDFVREVAVVSTPQDLQLLDLQLKFEKRILDIVESAQPIALISIQRKMETKEIPAEPLVDPATGLMKTPNPGTQFKLQLIVEFDGYTEVLRQFLNEFNLKDNSDAVKSIVVTRSPRSEEDKTSQLLEPQKKVNEKKTASSSPFAAYLQDETSEDISNPETKPLIGEVVSRFKLTVETGGQL